MASVAEEAGPPSKLARTGDETTPASDGRAVLHYFDGRGLGEIVRLCLEVAQAPYENRFINTKEEWEALKQTGWLLFGQVPLLNVDGKHLTQSMAIVRYLARKYDFYGANNNEAAEIDIWAGGLRDFISLLTDVPFSSEPEKDIAHIKTKLPRYLGAAEREFAQHPNAPYLVGSRLSFADLYFFEVMEYLAVYVGEKELAAYPYSCGSFAQLQALPALAQYLASERRPGFPDKRYTDAIHRILHS